MPATIMPMTIAAARSLLGIGETASIRNIQTAYRRLWRTHHPDSGAASSPEAHARLAELKRAYAAVMDYCEGFDIPLEGGSPGTDGYDHVERFYDGWLGRIKRSKREDD